MGGNGQGSAVTAATTMDDAVVRAALAGDARAFEVVYRDVQPRLLRYLQSLVGQDAADVAGETWLQVARDLGSFRGGADDLRGWIVTIGRRRALDAGRARGRRPSDPCEPALLPEPRPAVESHAGDAATAAEQALATRRALDLIGQLPTDQAEAVLLTVVVGLDGPAAARVLGKRAGAVRMARSRGLASLKVILQQQSVTLSDPAALRR